MTDTLTDRLAELTDDLLWMSESDYPWQVVCWNIPSITPDRLLESIDRPSDTPVEVVSVDRFFAPALTERSWHGEAERQTIARYRELVEFLNNNLDNLKVYRLGEVELDVYVLGTAGDRTIGIATKAVET